MMRRNFRRLALSTSLGLEPISGRQPVSACLVKAIASVAAVVVALAVPIGAGLLSAHSMNPFKFSFLQASSRVDLEAGSRLFASKCGQCHSLGSGSFTGPAPNLASIGKDAAGRRPGMSSAQYILESIVDPNSFQAPGARALMPRKISENLEVSGIRNLVGFLASRGATPNFAEIEGLEIVKHDFSADPPRKANLTQIQAGERLYRGKAGCIRCHDLERTPSVRLLLAPTLDAAAQQELDYLHQSIIDPSAKINETYITSMIALTNGEVVTGQIIRRSEDQIRVLKFDDLGHPTVRTILLRDVEIGDEGKPMIRQSDVSAMPKGFGETLNREEIEALIAFIKNLS